jgi:hypothetical protein
MEGNNRIILAHSEVDFSGRFADTLEECGYEVSTVKSLNDIAKKIEASGIDYSLVGFPLDEVTIAQANYFESFIGSKNNNSKIFAVISGQTVFSPVALEKIKRLRPRDFINQACTKEELLFKLSNILFEESGRRKNARWICNSVIHCDYKQDFFDAEAFTISRDGVFIKTDRAFPRDAKMFLNFRLPEDDFSFATMGTVLYSIGESSPKPRISPKGAGVYFVDLEPEARDRIDDFVRSSA